MSKQLTLGAATCKHVVKGGINEVDGSSEARRQITVVDDLTLGKNSGLVIDQSDYGSKVDEDDILERASTI